MRAGPGRSLPPGRNPTGLGSGIVISSPQEGHAISVPAPELSTANSCSHLGQLKITSISYLSLADCGDHNKTLAAPREEKSFERIPPGRILILPSDREPRSAYSYVLDNFSMRGQT